MLRKSAYTKYFSCSLVMVLILAYANTSWALRCGRKIVSIGDHKIDVQKKCGLPVLTERRTKIVGETLHHPGRTLDIEKYREIVVDEWTYNFGSRNFMQLLRFENGFLTEIEDLGYGY